MHVFTMLVQTQAGLELLAAYHAFVDLVAARMHIPLMIGQILERPELLSAKLTLLRVLNSLMNQLYMFPQSQFRFKIPITPSTCQYHVWFPMLIQQMFL